ncbi:MAG TPA: cytochrome c3 family protein [Bryobacteraceae bacterium]|nr:cytochrome c3 family protein [Bryobacteraceae bacterium]
MRFTLLYVLLASSAILTAQIAGDTIGVHDLSPSGVSSPVTGTLPGSCLYCHAPHSGIGGNSPLWNQKLSTQVYSPYSSSTDPTPGNSQPAVGSDTTLCLSCHDGTIAPGQTAVYGSIPMSGSMKSADVFGTNLQGSHPTSLVLPMKDAPYLAASLVSQGKTTDPTGAVRLIKGNVECTSCHNPHVQSIDTISQNFLVRDSSSGQLCLACHDPNRVVTGQTNPLAQWQTSIHATVSNTVATQSVGVLGSYRTVAQNACISCHMPHNAPGQARLLRGANEQDCLTCHNGSNSISPAAPNILAEFNKIAHPFPSGNNSHDAGEPVLLNQNRHSTCVDCHNAHSANQVLTFPSPPAIRGSQNGIAGISGSDGVTVLAPAVNQYENCLRCHGTSTGKTINSVFGYFPPRVVSAGDPLNLIPQFALSASSSHPVMHDRSSIFSQPSLRASMMNINGVTEGRTMGARILCTDCHNSDDNREFGGLGPSGPHGSSFPHILERRYEMSQAPAPGGTILNLFPNPDLSSAGPYALCEKCHDLNQIVANTSFSGHARHINDGFSCSVCHTAHGMGARSTTITGERMVNFDAKVVAANGTAPISYNRSANSCTLMCHGSQHPAAASSTKTKATKARK